MLRGGVLGERQAPVVTIVSAWTAGAMGGGCLLLRKRLLGEVVGEGYGDATG